MPNKNGTGPTSNGKRCRNRGSKQDQHGGRGRKNRPSGGQRSGGGKPMGQRQDQGKK